MTSGVTSARISASTAVEMAESSVGHLHLWGGMPPPLASVARAQARAQTQAEAPIAEFARVLARRVARPAAACDHGRAQRAR